MKVSKKKHHNTKRNSTFISKKLASIALMGLITLGAFAQNQKRGNQSDMTPDQMAELQTKKMTLHLELTDAQQKKVYNLNKEHAIEREARRKEMRTLREKGEKLAENNRFERKNTRLDAQLARQKEMKKILNETQYEIWKNSKNNRGQHMDKSGKCGKKGHHTKGNKRHGKRQGSMK